MRAGSPVAVILAAFVTGCAGPSAMDRVGGDLDALRAELKSVRSDMASASRSQEEARERDRAQTKVQLDGLEARAQDSEARLQKTLAELERLRTRITDIDARNARPGTPTAAPAPVPERPAERPAPAARTESPDQTYAVALATLRRGTPIIRSPRTHGTGSARPTSLSVTIGRPSWSLRRS
jgi:hypothetical protein